MFFVYFVLCLLFVAFLVVAVLTRPGAGSASSSEDPAPASTSRLSGPAPLSAAMKASAYAPGAQAADVAEGGRRRGLARRRRHLHAPVAARGKLSGSEVVCRSADWPAARIPAVPARRCSRADARDA